MDCKQAKILLAPYILGDMDKNHRLCEELQAHLLCCLDCAQMHEGFKETIGFVRDHKAEFAQAFERARVREKISKEAFADNRRARLLMAESEKPKNLKFFLRISAAAACLVIGILTWMIFSSYLKPQTLSQVSSLQEPSVKVELVRPSGNIAVAIDQEIVSDNEIKTLLINNKHQMIMNLGTSLYIEPLAANAQLGCLVKLTAGEIYTYVEHNGNPFIVDTDNGRAVITGTTFDIKATKDSTTLVVTEGTVRFESESGVVKVASGQTSEIVGQSTPSIPLSCSTAELTAWATGYKAGPALAKTELNPDPWGFPLSFGERPIVLADTDYNQWIEQKRDWFKITFPWMFELKTALTQEGIKVDYPELLIKSSDVWQFVCLQKFPARFSVPDFESLLRTAISYGFDKEWLLKNVPTAKSVRSKSLLSQNPTGLAAFEHWLKYAKGGQTALPFYYSADACKYLTATRSLIWFAVKEGKFNLTDNRRTEVLDLLQQEVIAATNCSNVLLYPKYEKKKSLCDDDLCEVAETKIIGCIEMIKVVEEKVQEYEIHN
jgi:hypothetical protein